jgi:hypothetical protein
MPKKANGAISSRFISRPDACTQVGAATAQVPVISTEFINIVMPGTYRTTDLDDLSQGLTPYQVNHHRAQGKATIVEMEQGGS